MPAYKRKSTTPSSYRNEKRSRKNARRYRIPGTLSGKTYVFARTVGFNSGLAYPLNSLITQGINGTGKYDMQLTFSLSAMPASVGGNVQNNWAVPNYTEFQNLFDLFRIKWVEVDVIYNVNSTSANLPTLSLPYMYSAVTGDDSNTTNLEAIRQFDSCKIHQLGNGPIKIRFKPKPSNLVFNGVTSGYSPTNNWLDTNYPDVPHYGLKLCFDPIFNTGGAAILGYISCSAKIIYEFKNTR